MLSGVESPRFLCPRHLELSVVLTTSGREGSREGPLSFRGVPGDPGGPPGGPRRVPGESRGCPRGPRALPGGPGESLTPLSIPGASGALGKALGPRGCPRGLCGQRQLGIRVETNLSMVASGKFACSSCKHKDSLYPGIVPLSGETPLYPEKVGVRRGVGSRVGISPSPSVRSHSGSS